jgi:hypothetical protein
MLKYWKIGGLGLLSILVYFYFGYELDRSHFYELLLGFSIAFGAYVLLVKQAEISDLRKFQYLGIVFRMAFLFSIPSLSDDYFRFIWDGQLIAHGTNPFDFLPAQISIDFPNKETLLAGMNSSQYYSIYPPIAQLVYYMGVLFSPNSILGSIISMRSIIILAEVGSIIFLPKILTKLKINPLNSLWYILNPLVIVELTGNLHFEGIMIFFLIGALFFFIQNKRIAGAILWSVSAGTKLIPLAFLPVLFREYKIKELVLIYGLVIVVFILLWLPLYNSEMLAHFSESFNLYFKSFEFNASLYYLVRWVGYQVTGYNIIAWAGEVLPKVALVIMLFMMMRKSNVDWIKRLESLLFAISIYYLFAFIVHPWYICTVLVLGIFTKYKFAILWSFLAVLSYWAYQTSDYQENLSLVAVEYIVVLSFFIYEFYKSKQITKLDSKLVS